MNAFIASVETDLADVAVPHAATPVVSTSKRHSSAPQPPEYDQAVFQSPTADALVNRLRTIYPDANVNVVRMAYAVAHYAHRDQRRQSGEPYINHPVDVATILLEQKMDADSVAAALLHDVVEDTSVKLEQIEVGFGADIAALVDGVTKLSNLEGRTKEEVQAGSYRKMFIAMADDPRVVLIKLADRLHNMRTLTAKSLEGQRKVARETLEIYAPLAHRLGMWQIKSELEDIAFKILNPEKYREIAQQLNLRRETREKIIQKVKLTLEQALEQEGLHASITGRPKHIYSIFRKMERKGVALDQIYDQLAVRVMVQNVGDCYRVLGMVHHLWTPLMSEFDDYIAVPKESLYKSLHTTVMVPKAGYCEVQIRTYDMHEVAEHGIAAHWRYKEGFGKSDAVFEAKMAWLRGLIEWRRDMSAGEFVESLKSDDLEEQVYVFTPKGKIIDLPEGSTPVDFAYRIHSEVGHRCVGARVNGKMVQLETQLRNGDVVEVMTTKTSRGPSRDWMNFVRTDSARSHIRRYFRRLERDENIVAGRDLMEKELKRFGLVVAFDDLVPLAGARNVEDVFALIGSGDVAARTLAQKILAQQTRLHEEEAPFPQINQPTPRTSTGIVIRGLDGEVLTRLAKCCNPVAGEPVVGYVTRGKGITVHRADCHTILNEPDRARLIEVSWGGDSPKGHPVPVRIESWDRVGLWRDVSAVIADAGINIERVEQGLTRHVGRAVLIIVMSIQSVNQLTMILDKLSRIPNVIEARRENSTPVSAA
ncbi:MAG: bifunctional (p)ppGpp synthetase/guanosine-3',5'-bis(diphosphate) 3'-pyrophosphohydrolase [Chloroflexaceae bacterium]|nr:bifunctional (p)ppGpp synthetase/guanosine-3',5'-bis(diphosphate) 3'-pyrophosphohydrolase [Chloroflexaceae bacterium]